jgi:sulfur carrier protein ThiS
MFGRKKEITILIKLFGGLDADLGIEDYAPETGFSLQVVDRMRLGKVIRKIGFSKTDTISVFINGNPAGPGEKLSDGDVILCMRPLAGG